MKSKRQLFASLFQIIIGVLAIIAFIIVARFEEEIIKWIITLILSIAITILGIIGIIDYYKDNKKRE